MTSGDLKSCDFAKDYFEFRKVLSSRDEPIRHLPCGSFFELPLLYVLSNPTDIDLMYCDMTLCAIYNHVNIPERHAKNVQTIETTDCHIGFVRLRYGDEYLRNPYDDHSGAAEVAKLPIPITYLRLVLGMIYHRWFDIDTLTKDTVYALRCPMWPQDAIEWITRKRLNGWPTKNIVEEVVRGGCHLVSKPHGKNPNDDTQWRYSFSQAETILIRNTWTDVQKYIYPLLRIIKGDVVRKCGGVDKSFLSNYYIKTLMLWKCEEKPSEFWDDKNIVTSVRELLLEFIEKLIERNMPHYFMLANNIMDDIPYNADADNEIRILISYRKEDILELIRKEPKAYQRDSGFILVPNQSLYPLTAKLSHILYLSKHKVNDRQLQESQINSLCSSNYLFPELEYLYKGIMMHIQLSKLNNYENETRRQECITSAEDLFDRSIEKLNCGFTRFSLYLGWSISEFYQKFWRLCVDEQFQNRNIMLCSGSCRPMPMKASTSCYVINQDYYLKNHCSPASDSTRTSNFPILQQIILKEITVPFNSTYFVCSAYRANFFCNALCNYKRALELCEEANKLRHCFSSFRGHLFVENLHFPLKHDWCCLYDKYIQRSE